MTAHQTTAEKLTALGFTDEIYAATTLRTVQVMQKQIDADPDLADRVFDIIRDEYTPYPIQDIYHLFLQDWIQEQANALHREHTKNLIAPFKAIASLF